MSLLEMDSKVQEINTPKLVVKDNVIAFTDYFIQISNISEASISPIPAVPYPIIAIVLLLIGVILTLMGIGNSIVAVIMGVLMLVIGAIPIYKVYQKNKNRGEVLILDLNSGKKFYFKCYNRDFLREVLNVLKSCVNKEVKSITVDFSNSVISNSPIIGGNNNKVGVEV